MKGNALALIAALLLVIGSFIGLAVYFGDSFKKKDPSAISSSASATSTSYSLSQNSNGSAGSSSASGNSTQSELEKLSAKTLNDLQEENRTNLKMFAQLRSYKNMLSQIQTYAEKVEKDIEIIKEINKEEFQEDVQLQASLFSGKKPTLVAKHLEEFKASRVGAILAKMKEKEASVVMDVWAKQEDPRVSAFYREVITSYLNNKRHDANPELFNKMEPNPKAAVAER